jgi:putative tryptophan/tyrosine transport system substrate-binding protein
MKRRDFISLFGGAAAAFPLAARAQQAERMRRVGVLHSSGEPDEQPVVLELQQQLQKLGWSSSRNLVLDHRFGGK